MQNKKIEHDYINILKDSLKSKAVLLDELIAVNEEQLSIASDDKAAGDSDGDMFDYDGFDDTMKKKEDLIGKLNRIDDGFTSVYERVKDLLNANKAAYAKDIAELKELIVEVTDKTVELEVSERRNREAVEKKTNRLRDKVRAARTTTKAAVGYYRNMTKLNVVEPQFMDRKK